MKSRETSDKRRLTKLTVSVSRSAVATLDRIRADRFERGFGRREMATSRLIEEAIDLLKRNEGTCPARPTEPLQ